MNKTRLKICATVVFCLLQTQTFVFAAGQRNLALHKKLDYSPKPEYHLTVHPRDPFKLTDGIKDRSLWYEDYRDKTVGWAKAPLIEITLDLGQVYDVGLINIYTVGGGQSGVEYPEYAAAAVSLGGANYSLAGYSASDGWVFGTTNAIPRTIVLPVEQKARYIKLFVRPIGTFFFTDEIEVIESQVTPRDVTTGKYLSKDQMIDLIERARQLDRDRDVLSEKVQKSLPMANGLSGDWQTMKERISLLRRNLTEMKVSQTEAEFAQFRAKWVKLQYGTEWLCYPTEPMDILRHGDLPPSAPNDFQISLYQWRNEHGAATINVTNSSMAPINFSVHFSPLRYQDKTIESAGIFELRRALYVRVLNAGLVADPLVLQNSKPFPVAPGQTVQLWVDAYSKDLNTGAYTAAMVIDASGENIDNKQHVVPIRLEVANRIFPDKIPFLSCNWDYVAKNDTFTSKDLKKAIVDLKNHYINISVILPNRIYGKRGRELAGKYILPSMLEPELKLYKDSTIVLLWLGMDWRLKDHFGEFKTSDGEYNIVWKDNFKTFLSELVPFMLDKGYNYESFAIYLFDEYIGDDFIYVARIIKDFDPRLKIYANNWIESESQFRKVKDLIDIWCPPLPEVIANKNTFEKYKNLGTFDKIWCYYANIQKRYFFSPETGMIGKLWRGGPNRTAFRTMPIASASLGMTGAGFWVYQDSDKAGWTEDKMGEYGVVYDGSQNPDKNCFPEAIVPSKRWQQWREGVEDAVCLTGHKELLEEFFQASNSKLTSEYLTSLRRRADEEKGSVK
jgi:hypothetical protein